MTQEISIENQVLKGLDKVKIVWPDLLMSLNAQNGTEVLKKQQSFMHSLMHLPVSNLSTFTDMIWNYNSDVLNPPASVKGAKLKINFNDYNLPLPIIVELKLLLWLGVKYPQLLDYKQKRGSNKPNTILSGFKNACRFLEHVVNYSRNKFGQEYVDTNYEFLCQIPTIDFEEAAGSFTGNLKGDSGIPRVLSFGNSRYAQDVLDIKIYADSEKLSVMQSKKPSKNKKEGSIYLKEFSHEQFNMLNKVASFSILQYLEIMHPDKDLSEIAHDKTGSFHYDNLKQLLNSSSVNYTREQVLRYMTYRLKQKGWSNQYINEQLPGVKIYSNFSSKKLGIYGIKIWLENVYNAACYVINQYSAMRPNAIASVRFDIPWGEDNGLDLLMSDENKGRNEKYQLFDDAYPLSPLMKDAWLVAKKISILRASPFLFSSSNTQSPDAKPSEMVNTGAVIQRFFKHVYPKSNHTANSYTCRHTLVYQLYRADVGLPVISYHLKHLVETVKKYTSIGGLSSVTLDYGGLADRVNSAESNTKDGLRKKAEIDLLKETLNPNAIYLGDKANPHKARLKKAFLGYMAAGYSEEEIYEAMVNQGFALVNVGTGMCFADEDITENFDSSIPCIGGLRCNPLRCTNSVVTKANVPKWREIYLSNIKLIGLEGYENRQDQILAILEEAKGVLEYLGEEVI